MSAQNAIQAGDYVRSFDFASQDLEGDNACYAEGEVIAIAKHPHAPHLCYHIRVERRVFQGEDSREDVGDIVLPPINGLHNILRDTYTNGVSKIDRPEPAMTPRSQCHG